MKVQRFLSEDEGQVGWTVIDDDYLPIQPIQEYLIYLKHLERSPHTIRAYAHHLRLFWEYLSAIQITWTAVGLSELADFLAWLRNPQPGILLLQETRAKRSESTVSVILAAVTMFYDYHERIGNVETPPLYRSSQYSKRSYKGFLHHITKSKPVQTRLLKLKMPRRIPRILTSHEVKQLIDACYRLRDKFLISLLYETGMRIGQALGLHHEDIHSWDNLIRIVPRDNNANGARAKTRESYSIHVSPALMALYTDYLIREFDETESDYVFVNLWEGEVGRPMTYEAAKDMFHRVGQKSNIQVHAHLLRHTHATELLQNGMDATYVQKRLGHANVQTTISTYVHLTDEDLKQAYQHYVETRGQE